MFRLLGNMSDERNYDYSQDEAQALCDYLANLVEDLRCRMVKTGVQIE